MIVVLLWSGARAEGAEALPVIEAAPTGVEVGAPRANSYSESFYPD
jgi:hypothetical protein